MNLRRFIDKNRKLIGYLIIIILFAFISIKALNSYYEEDEKRKKQEVENIKNNTSNIENGQSTNVTDKKNDIEKTMETFVEYCNNRKIEKAYEMLTEQCKEAMFPTVEDFEKIYINTVYDVTRTYKLVKWSTEENRVTYNVKLSEDILATGNIGNSTEEYYTFVKNDDGTYKLNVNNYIYGEDKNIEDDINGINVKIKHVDVYDEYESTEIVITNNSDKIINLTGNKYMKNIYLKNAKGTAYSSFNSEFDSQELIMNPNSVRTFIVKFNKSYDAVNKARYLILSDVIMDYEDYLNSEDKNNYWNRRSFEIEY